jgi:protein-tyrosine phosphatase
VRWPDFWLPTDRGQALEALVEAWELAEHHRVEIACLGGRGRTGTALACLARLDGMPADQVVAFVRQHYAARAVETPWQRHYAEQFTPGERTEAP